MEVVIYPEEIRWDEEYMNITCLNNMRYAVLPKSQAYTFFAKRQNTEPAKVCITSIASKKYITKAEDF